MIDADYLIDIFKTLDRPIRESFFRSIPLKYGKTPLSAIGSLRDGGRYNEQDAFAVLYVADSEDAVLRETRAVVLDPDTGLPATLPHAPRVHFTIDVILQSVVDLTDEKICDDLGIHPGDLLVEWRLLLRQDQVPLTHTLGAAARDADIEALIVPSARLPGRKNLAIVVDRIRVGSVVEIFNPDGFSEGSLVRIDGAYRP